MSDKNVLPVSERSKNVTNVPLERRTITPEIPKSVKIEVTSRCDLKCYFCQLTIKDRVKKDINSDLFYKIIDDLKSSGVEEVGLFWIGEPFINKLLPDYVKYAKSIGIPRVFITTNGRLASYEKLKAVFDAGLDSIKFSINASTAEQYLATTKVDAFDKVINNIKIAHKARGNNKASISASSAYNEDKPEDYEMIDKLISPYVDDHYKIKLYGDTVLNEGEFEFNENNRDLQSMLPCWSVFNVPHISYDGFLSACFSDFGKEWYMADLKKVSFIEGWNSEKFKKLREAHLKKDVTGTPCEHCTAYKI
jgi:MoaA/NifB/PqqE/SkfB family radical SAM enzyme